MHSLVSSNAILSYLDLDRKGRLNRLEKKKGFASISSPGPHSFSERSLPDGVQEQDDKSTMEDNAHVVGFDAKVLNDKLDISKK
jgi:hypothetical protein